MKTRCPHCKTLQSAPDDAAGRKALCKFCREPFEIQNAAYDAPGSSEPLDHARVQTSDQTPEHAPAAAVGSHNPRPVDPDGPHRKFIFSAIGAVLMIKAWAPVAFCVCSPYLGLANAVEYLVSRNNLDQVLALSLFAADAICYNLRKIHHTLKFPHSGNL